MSENTEVLLVIWAFWLAVAALDVAALVRLRRAMLPAAAALWTVWIVAAPVVGAVSFFIVVRSDSEWPVPSLQRTVSGHSPVRR